ncbi:MAG: stage II sporulation protein M [Clostridium sp.]|nr:stage II sporulation protein M [Clostridium sp.]
MRIGMAKVRTGKIPYLAIFFAGFLAGIFLMNIGRKTLLENTGLLDEYTLYQMKYMTVDGNALFVFVLRERLKTVGFLAVMATTYLGLLVTGGMALWYGVSAGMFLSAAVIRYGMKGVLFVVTGIFPQCLFYVPAMAALLLWCEQLCRALYSAGGAAPEMAGRRAILRKLLFLLLLAGAVVLGCLLESHVNPYLLSKLLKIF